MIINTMSFDEYDMKECHPVSFLNMKKKWNIHFVGNLILSTSREFCYDEVTVTAFVKLNLATLLLKSSRKEQHAENNAQIDSENVLLTDQNNDALIKKNHYAYVQN